MRIVGLPNPSGSRYWRLDHPFKYLRELDIDAQVTEEPISDQMAINNDIIVCQFTVDKEGLALLRAYQKLRGKKIVAEFDDFIYPNEDNPNLMEHQISQASDVLEVLASMADAITCTTNHLGKKLGKLNKNVYVLPNFVDLSFWEKPRLINDTGYINIGWAGGMSHHNDLQNILVEPMKRILKEFPNVKLYIVGEWRARKWFEGYKNVEVMLAVPFEAYPTRLQGLRLDIGLAPVEDNEFNRCKTNIKWQEYSINKIAGVYSPTVYNRRGFEPKFGMIANTPEEWYLAVKQLILHPDMREEMAQNSYNLVKSNYSLKKNIGLWKKTYESILDLK